VPIYEYQCERCNHKLEIIQKISDEQLRFCPECGAETLRKLISAVSFRLKGTGWYETDFKNKVKDSGDAKPDTSDTSDTSKAKVNSSTTETKAADKSG
jgi:putative FmdB family regulatory protein